MEELTIIEQAIVEMNHHIATLNDEGAETVYRLTCLEKDMEWLLKFFWLLMAGIIGNLIAQYFAYKSIKKNDK